MNIKKRIPRQAGLLWISFMIHLLFIFSQGPLYPAYGNTESVREDLAFLAEEGQVVQSASKYPQLVKNAPASVTLITRDDIKYYGWRTLAELLKSIRGFYVTDDKNYSYLGVKGFQRAGDYNSRILALLNGHTLNEDVYQQFFMGNDSGIDLDIVDRVEIVRGAGSALYGTNAIFAVINIITKDGKDINGLRSSLEAGSGNSNKGIVTYGKTLSSGWDVLTNISYFKSMGQSLRFSYYDNGDPANHGGITSNDGEYAYNVYFKAHYHDLSIQLAGNDREKQIPTASYGAIFNDPREETFDGHYLAELKYDHSLSENFGIMARIYDDWYRYRGYYPFPDSNPSGTKLNTDYSVGQYIGGEIQFRWDYKNVNKFIIGTEYQKHHVLLQNYDIEPFAPGLDVDTKFDVLSLYVEDEFKFSEYVALNFGGRRDQYINYIDSFSDKWTPRIALVVSPYSETTLKILYGVAFRAPSSYELFYSGTNIAPGRAEPETITTWEAVWEQTLGMHLSSSLSGFYYVADKLIELVSIDPINNLNQYQNVSRVSGNGVEGELRGHWDGRKEAYINATYQVTRNDATQSELSNSPNLLAKAGFVVPLMDDRAHFALEEQYTSERDTIADATGVIQEVDPYCVTNMTLSIKNLIDQVDFQASIFNFFDNKYSDPASNLPFPILQIPQRGRTFFLKTSYLF
ncbi:MAG: TonB-dependent receptor [Nitrospirae bacterium]|nr:TonB-dependent receptor [Nitrospirota bacterium]